MNLKKTSILFVKPTQTFKDVEKKVDWIRNSRPQKWQNGRFSWFSFCFIYFILGAEDINPPEIATGTDDKNPNKSLFSLAKRIGRGQPRRAEKFLGNKYVPITKQCKTF